MHHGRNSQPSLDSNGEKRYSAVSPIESPTLGAGLRDSGSSFCVSPIDEADQLPRRERNGSRTSAHGPISQPQAVPSPPRMSQPASKSVEFAPTHMKQTRWDAFSGEPSDTGKASQVNPRDSTFHKSSGSHASSLLNWGREQLQSKKLAQARSRISSFPKSETPAAPETSNRSSSRVLPSEEHSGDRAGTDVNSRVNPSLGFVPTVVTTITAGDPKPLPQRPATERAYESSRQELPDNNFNPTMDTMLRPGHPSRGVGASVRGPQGSLDESPRESLNLSSESTEDLHSIMSRRRPIPVHMPVSKKPVRKPTPSEAGQKTEVAQPTDDCPKDTQSRIASLEARRNELAKRRLNLETLITELTRVIQPTSPADLAAKAEVKKSVQSIENEIAEIKRDEHELGLKVTRAWRRLDEKENSGDGSNLWVKRVTS